MVCYSHISWFRNKEEEPVVILDVSLEHSFLELQQSQDLYCACVWKNGCRYGGIIIYPTTAGEVYPTVQIHF